MATYMQFTQHRFISSITRLNNSRNGNPRWRFDFDNGEQMTTKSDSSFNYEVSPSWQGKDAVIKYHFTPKGKPVIDGVVGVAK